MYIKNTHFYHNISVRASRMLPVCRQTQLTQNVKATFDIYEYKIISNRIFYYFITLQYKAP